MSSVWNICANVPQMSFGSETSNGIENSLRASSLGRFTMGREKEGEPATMFLEFEYLHRVDVKCWLAKMTLVIFLVFFDHYAHSRLFPLCADWQKSDSSVNGEQQGNWRHNSNFRDIVASSPSFSCPTAKALKSLHSGYVEKCQAVFSGYTLNATTHTYNLPTIYMCYCTFTLHFFCNFC